MQLDIPDPAHARHVQGRFRLAAKVAIGFVVLLWVIHAAGAALGLEPALSGIRPRQVGGLAGIVFAPLVHAGFEHLLANSLPLVVLLTAMLSLYPGAVPATLPAVWLGPGLAVWLLGSERSVHFGASGVVYGLAAFVLAAGVLRRDRGAVAASLVVWFLYGPMVWGVLPTRAGMSWETHLAAALIGAAWAVALRHRDVPPRRRYTWEDGTPPAS
jgi:membrane associated rhomboid family serine protease